MNKSDCEINLDGIFKSNVIEECEGLVFKGYISKYLTKDLRIEEKQGLRLIKRLSCNCDRCHNILSEIYEAIGEYVILPKTIEKDGLYKPVYINQSRDWETGIIDNYDITFKKIG